MNHPFMNNLSEFTETEIENKISTLNRTYFIANNEEVRHQIILALDSLKIELEARRARAYVEQLQKDDKDNNNGLDNLINVS